MFSCCSGQYFIYPVHDCTVVCQSHKKYICYQIDNWQQGWPLLKTLKYSILKKKRISVYFFIANRVAEEKQVVAFLLVIDGKAYTFLSDLLVSSQPKRISRSLKRPHFKSKPVVIAPLNKSLSFLIDFSVHQC